ncbi:MAG: hypothetical protein R2800_15165 [Flavipsychrobacter sp.]
MKNTTTIAALLVFISSTALAQSTSSSAGQNIILTLTDAIEFSFINTGNSVGNDVTLPFSNVNAYANGVESTAQELKVRSNKGFTVTVKTTATNFSYNGSATPVPVMPILQVLGLQVTANGTGGNIAAPFANSSYNTLSSTSQNLINYGHRGGNQTFSIKYKATPGFAYPAGTYTAEIVYTATQT